MSNATTLEQRRQQRRARALFALAVALLVVWCGVIAWFSAGTGEESQSLSDGTIARVLAVLQPGFAQLAPEQQAEAIAAWSFPVRKLAHFSEYAVLCALALNALLRARRVFGRLSGLGTAAVCATAVVFCALYACGDEFHQLFVSGRAARLFDVGVDTLGAVACAAVFAAVSRVKAKQKCVDGGA